MIAYPPPVNEKNPDIPQLKIEITPMPRYYGKLDATPSDLVRLIQADPNVVQASIFEVSEPNYVPPGVTVRARISSTLFTGNYRIGELERIATDEKVARIGMPTRLNPYELPSQ